MRNDNDEILGIYISDRAFLRDQLEIFMEEKGYAEWMVAGLIAETAKEQPAIKAALERWLSKRTNELYVQLPARNLELCRRIEIELLQHPTTNANIRAKASRDTAFDYGTALSRFVLGADEGTSSSSREKGQQDLEGVLQVMRPHFRDMVLDRVPEEYDDWTGWMPVPEYYYFKRVKDAPFMMVATLRARPFGTRTGRTGAQERCRAMVAEVKPMNQCC